MSIARRYAVVIATFACAALLIVGTGCSSCFVKPVTTERKGPELMLNLVDLLNSKNNLKNIPAQRYNGSVPPLSLNGANYNYLFFIVATDPGGISSFDYSETFSTGCPCNPGSNSCGGSFASGIRMERFLPCSSRLSMSRRVRRKRPSVAPAASRVTYLAPTRSRQRRRILQAKRPKPPGSSIFHRGRFSRNRRETL
jgi:hypothetical protein